MKHQLTAAYEKEHQKELKMLDRTVLDRAKYEQAVIDMAAAVMTNTARPLDVEDIVALAFDVTDEIFAKFEERIN